MAESDPSEAVLPPGSVLHVLGPEKSFSHRAGEKVLENMPGCRLEFVGSIPELIALARAGHYVLLPYYNSSDGDTKYLRQLVEAVGPDSVAIYSVMRYEVRMCLGVIPGTPIEEITELVSQRVALGQCSQLKWRLTGEGTDKRITETEVASTPLAAKHVAAQGDRSKAALGSAEAIQDAGLDIAMHDVANAQLAGNTNLTHFLVAGPPPEGGSQLRPELPYHAILVDLEDVPGAEVGAKKILSDIGCNLRPSITLPSGSGQHGEQAMFFIEFEYRGAPAKLEQAIEEMRSCGMIKSLRILGSWNGKHTATKS